MAAPPRGPPPRLGAALALAGLAAVALQAAAAPIAATPALSKDAEVEMLQQQIKELQGELLEQETDEENEEELSDQELALPVNATAIEVSGNESAARADGASAAGHANKYVYTCVKSNYRSELNASANATAAAAWWHPAFMRGTEKPGIFAVGKYVEDEHREKKLGACMTSGKYFSDVKMACVEGRECSGRPTMPFERGICVKNGGHTECWDVCNEHHKVCEFKAAGAHVRHTLLRIVQVRLGLLAPVRCPCVPPELEA